MREFLAMGGYAFYVWMSFGLTFLVMAMILLSSVYQRRQAIDKVKKTALIAERNAKRAGIETQGSESHQ